MVVGTRSVIFYLFDFQTILVYLLFPICASSSPQESSLFISLLRFCLTYITFICPLLLYSTPFCFFMLIILSTGQSHLLFLLRPPYSKVVEVHSKISKAVSPPPLISRVFILSVPVVPCIFSFLVLPFSQPLCYFLFFGGASPHGQVLKLSFSNCF